MFNATLSHCCAAVAILLLLGAIATSLIDVEAVATYCKGPPGWEVSALQDNLKGMAPFFGLAALYVLSYFTAFSPRITAIVGALAGALVVYGSLAHANHLTSLECGREANETDDAAFEMLGLLMAYLWFAVELVHFIVSTVRGRRSLGPRSTP